MVFANESVKDMEESQFHAGLAAKVDISVNIAEVFAKESLDFILFSLRLFRILRIRIKVIMRRGAHLKTHLPMSFPDGCHARSK